MGIITTTQTLHPLPLSPTRIQEPGRWEAMAAAPPPPSQQVVPPVITPTPSLGSSKPNFRRNVIDMHNRSNLCTKVLFHEYFGAFA